MTAVVEWLVALPAPLFLSMVTLALIAEAGLLVGLVIPGTTVVLTAGAVAQLTAVPLPAAVAAAAAGAVAGGQLGYRRGHRRRSEPAPIEGGARIVPAVWPAIHRNMHRRTVQTVLIGQWVPYGRALVPRAAGWAGTPRRTFTVVQTTSAVAWAGVLTTVGYSTATAARGNLPVVLALAGAVVLCGLVVRVRSGRAERRAAPARPLCEQGAA